MGVHDVEGVVGIVEGVDVAERELHVGAARGVGPGVLQRLGHRLDPLHPAGSDPFGDVDGDRPGPAAHVEDVRPGSQEGRDVGGRVGDRPDGVGAQDAGGVPVGVGLAVGAHRPMLDPLSHLMQQTSHYVDIADAGASL